MKNSTTLLMFALSMFIMTIYQRHSGVNLLTTEFTGLAGTLYLVGAAICKELERNNKP